MILVPRQLQHSGMTGSVPYYGGRFTPAQAYAASHPNQPVPAGLASPLGRPGPPVRTAADADPAPPGPRGEADQLDALQQLLDGGLLTTSEYEQLRARVTG